MAATAILGVILAGGRSSRMGTDKALLPIGGMPLAAHVAARLGPQVAKLVINADGGAARFAELGLQVIGDGDPGGCGFAGGGPLTGIAAALDFAQRSGFQRLATAPVDAPLLPLDLVSHLAAGRKNEVVVAGWLGAMEPLFALWPVEFVAHVASALAEGERAVHRMIEHLPHRIVDFPGEAGASSPFLNLNTPEDVAQFEQLSLEKVRIAGHN